jgi:chromosome segregation ATPase
MSISIPEIIAIAALALMTATLVSSIFQWIDGKNKDERIERLERARRETQELADRHFADVQILSKKYMEAAAEISRREARIKHLNNEREALTKAYIALSERTVSAEATRDARIEDLNLANASLRSLQADYLKLQRSSEEGLEKIRAAHGINS